MSVNVFWDAPMVINSPYENVALNEPWVDTSTGKTYIFQTTVDNYAIVPGKGENASGGFRPVVDSLSQADGMSIQPPFIDGLVATLELQFFVCPDGTQASKVFAGSTVENRPDLQHMLEVIMGVLNSLRTYPPDVSTQQYAWLPPGDATYRLLDGVMLGSWPTPDFSKGPPEVRLKFDLVCPYPYAILADPHTTGPITPGGSDLIGNLGNTAQFPILMIPGPMTYTKVTVNVGLGAPYAFEIVYDHSLPGAMDVPSGHTLQIDFHEGSCLLDGDPTLDYIAGLDPTLSTFWPLQPNQLIGGPNTVAVDVAGDGDVTVVSYDAWL